MSVRGFKTEYCTEQCRVVLTVEGFEYLIPVWVYLVSPSTTDGTRVS